MTGRVLALAAMVLLLAGADAADARTRFITVTTELQSPTAIAFRPGIARPVVAEQKGRIVELRGKRIREIANLSDRVSQGGGERGLLGLAFHPDFRKNGRVFVNYTDRAGTTQIVELRRGPNQTIRVDTAKTILTLRQPYANHNGGHLAFGPDGYLYIGTGDGGSGGDPGNRALDPFSPLGKILRLDVDGGDPYAIPPDNPFASGEAGSPLVWAMGLRNPWRFSFDRRGGALWVADVGQSSWEEINRVGPRRPPLPNFGWKAFEGREPYAPQPIVGTAIQPVMVYSHTGGRCSITGGYVYRGKKIRFLRGRYVFGDWCTGQIWYLNLKRKRMVRLPVTLKGVTTFAENARGELILASSDGSLVRLVR